MVSSKIVFKHPRKKVRITEKFLDEICEYIKEGRTKKYHPAFEQDFFNIMQVLDSDPIKIVISFKNRIRFMEKGVVVLEIWTEKTE
jgi:hypothetical protein